MPISDAEIFVAKHGQTPHFTPSRQAQPPKVKGMMTLTYDLDLLHKYLGPKRKIRHQVRMSATRYFDSATPTSYSTSYTPNDDGTTQSRKKLQNSNFYTTRESARHVRPGSSIPRTTLTSWTDRLAITNDTAAILAKIMRKRASGDPDRWRPNRKWKYGSDPIFRLSDPDFLFDFITGIMGSISNRYGACIREC